MKIKAFTMLELMVVMIITTIVVGLAYSSYQILLKQQIIYQNQGEEIVELELFKTKLRLDIEKSNEIIQFGNELKCIQINGEALVYLFKENYVVHSQGQSIDTLYHGWNELETVKMENAAFVNQVMINFSENTSVQNQMNFIKKYSPAQEINNLYGN